MSELAKSEECSYLSILSDSNKLKVGNKQKQAFGDFNKLISKFQTAYQKQDAISITTDLLLDIDLKNYYENQNTQEAKERWENVEELLNSITDFQEYRVGRGLSEFLEEVSLLTDIDRWNESEKGVTLMTIHSAKGLEFPVVIRLFLLCHRGRRHERRERDDRNHRTHSCHGALLSSVELTIV